VAEVISRQTRNDIVQVLESFIDSFVDRFLERFAADTPFWDPRPMRNEDVDGRIKPFHEAMLPEGILRVTEFERSFSTKLGDTYEAVAAIIGRSRWARSERNYRLRGSAATSALTVIDDIVRTIGSKGWPATYVDLTAQVASTYAGSMVKEGAEIDLYLADDRGNEVFIEIKSPKPNKGQSLDCIRKLLLTHAIRRASAPRVRSYYGMAYNPWGGGRQGYKDSIGRRFLDFDTMVLLQEEFWDLVGGPGTYAEVVALYRDVGRRKAPEVLKRLGFSSLP